MSNDSSANVLAREIEYRFMFLFITSRFLFDAMREISPMSDLDCFLYLISMNLSEPAKQLLEAARKRHGRYNELVDTVVRKSKNAPANKTPLQLEAVQIKAIVDFEVKSNKGTPDWSFQRGGLHRLTDDFLLFQEYQALSESDRFKGWISRYGNFLLTKEERDELKNASQEERAQRIADKAGPILQPIWSFFMALCYTLQQGENEFLTATDAYWLGLIDEVIGDQSLHPSRLIYETTPDEQPIEKDEKAETGAEEKTSTGGA